MFYIVLLEFLVRSHPMPVSLGYIQSFFPTKSQVLNMVEMVEAVVVNNRVLPLGDCLERGREECECGQGNEEKGDERIEAEEDEEPPVRAEQGRR